MWKTTDRRISIKGRIVAKKFTRQSQDRGEAVSDREHVRCRLLCHDLDSDANFFWRRCGLSWKVFTTSPHTLIMVARTLDTVLSPYPDTCMPVEHTQTNVQTVCSVY